MKGSLLAVPLTLLALAAGVPTRAAEPAQPATSYDAVVERIENLTADELKEFYLRCSRAAMRGRLSNGEISLCSLGYERLLMWTFGGDFHALLEWRRGTHGVGEPARPSPF